MKLDSYDVYLHGQILGTHTFFLKNGFPVEDEYSELKMKTFLPGGETGTAATVLASLGINVKMDGTHIGTEVAPMLREFYENKTVDLSSLYFDSETKGVMDYVLVHGLYRTPMGFFQTLWEDGLKYWNAPKKEDIIAAKVAGIDPFFADESEQAARICREYNVPYVTIDCPHTDYLHQNAAINVVSKECIGAHYKDVTKEEAFRLLSETTDGLVIITSGEKDMIYGRKSTGIHYMPVFETTVRSTLGAGDTFKAGCIAALLRGLNDEETVAFAAACSSVAVSRYPLPLNPPKQEEVDLIIKKRF